MNACGILALLNFSLLLTFILGCKNFIHHQIEITEAVNPASSWTRCLKANQGLHVGIVLGVNISDLDSVHVCFQGNSKPQLKQC